jgi:hypothetical protein
MAGELEALEAAAAGLLYPSESDEPITAMTWKAEPTFSGKSVEEQTLAEFFAELEQGDEGEKFKRLRRVIEKSLPGAKVYRVGEVRVDVYIVGKTAQGDWMGLQTLSVET